MRRAVQGTDMRKLLSLLLVALSVLPLACTPGVRPDWMVVRGPREGSRFERALVFPGGGFQFAMFLGMLEGLESHGERPDVIIGACGGAVAAAIATTIARSAERRAFIESEDFFRILRSATMEKARLASVLAKLWHLNWRRWSGDGLPNVFTGTLVHLPPQLPLPELDRPFGASGIRAVIVAARVGFQPKDVGAPRDGRKLYRQVFFTDPDTGLSLRDLESPIARLFPDSAVQVPTEVLPDQRPGVAARLSIADPFYLNPVPLDDGYYYLTGAIDLYPLETAQGLAKKIWMPFPSGFKTFPEQKAIQNTFDYDNNRRLQYVTSGFAARWIDISDVGGLYAEHGFDPRFDVWSLSVKTGVPESYEVYRRSVRAQWEYGRQRAIEALREPENGKRHIRVMDDTKTTREVRCTLGRENCREPFHPAPNT